MTSSRKSDNNANSKQTNKATKMNVTRIVIATNKQTKKQRAVARKT